METNVDNGSRKLQNATTQKKMPKSTRAQRQLSVTAATENGTKGPRRRLTDLRGSEFERRPRCGVV